jgi:predicted nucleic acid-binding protein
LLRVEVAGAITRKFRNNQLNADDTKEALILWQNALAGNVVELSHDSDDLDDSSVLSMQLKHPLQDCLYLALAQRLHAKFVTADEILHRRASEVFPSVTLLREFTN